MATFADAFYQLPLEYAEQIQVWMSGSADQVAAQLGRYVDAGARHIVLRIASLERGDHLERVAAALPDIGGAVSR
jgi:hypothetical protein